VPDQSITQTIAERSKKRKKTIKVSIMAGNELIMAVMIFFKEGILFATLRGLNILNVFKPDKYPLFELT
jgi:hypothetical protein